MGEIYCALLEYCRRSSRALGPGRMAPSPRARPRAYAAVRCLAALLWLLRAAPLLAQTPAAGDLALPLAASANLEQRVRQLEQSLAEVAAQNRQLSSQLRELSGQNRRPRSDGIGVCSQIQALAAPADQPTDDADDSPLMTQPRASGIGAADLFPMTDDDSGEDFLVGNDPCAKRDGGNAVVLSRLR